MLTLASLSPSLEGTVDDGVLEFACPLGHPHRINIPIGARWPGKSWASGGQFPDSLTLTPSILAYNAAPNDRDLMGDAYTAASTCGWHGFITDGEVTTC